MKQEFAQAMQTFWHVLIGIGALGFVSSLLMKGLPLHIAMDEKFALEQAREGDIGALTPRDSGGK